MFFDISKYLRRLSNLLSVVIVADVCKSIISKTESQQKVQMPKLNLYKETRYFYEMRSENFGKMPFISGNGVILKVCLVILFSFYIWKLQTSLYILPIRNKITWHEKSWLLKILLRNNHYCVKDQDFS